jgi:hypothetical protein
MLVVYRRVKQGRRKDLFHRIREIYHFHGGTVQMPERRPSRQLGCKGGLWSGRRCSCVVSTDSLAVEADSDPTAALLCRQHTFCFDKRHERVTLGNHGECNNGKRRRRSCVDNTCFVSTNGVRGPLSAIMASAIMASALPCKLPRDEHLYSL